MEKYGKVITKGWTKLKACCKIKNSKLIIKAINPTEITTFLKNLPNTVKSFCKSPESKVPIKIAIACIIYP